VKKNKCAKYHKEEAVIQRVPWFIAVADELPEEAYYDISLKPQNIDAAFQIYRTAKKGTTLLDADGKTIESGRPRQDLI
jgi:hypothetical protein